MGVQKKNLKTCKCFLSSSSNSSLFAHKKILQFFIPLNTLATLGFRLNKYKNWPFFEKSRDIMANTCKSLKKKK